jgi:hypothetical protein
MIITNYKLTIHGTIVIKAEKNLAGEWELSSEPPGLLEELLISQIRKKREK